MLHKEPLCIDFKDQRPPFRQGVIDPVDSRTNELSRPRCLARVDTELSWSVVETGRHLIGVPKVIFTVCQRDLVDDYRTVRPQRPPRRDCG